MKKLILFSGLAIMILQVCAENQCFLKIGGIKFEHGSIDDPISQYQGKSWNHYILPETIEKETMLNNIFGNIYFTCNDSESKIKSFNLHIQNESGQSFSRTYTDNYILKDESISSLLDKCGNYTIYLDNIKLQNRDNTISISISPYTP